MSIVFKIILSYFIRMNIFDYFMVRYISGNIKKVCLINTGLKVVILDIDRFREDIKALCDTKKISLFSLDIHIQDKLNGVSEYRFYHLFRYLRNIYGQNDNILVVPSEAGLVYIHRILPKIMHFSQMNCVLSCGMLYKRNVNWEKALFKGKYPFYCMHREAIGLSAKLSSRINKSYYSFDARKYYGDMLFVGVHHFKNLLLDIGYIEDERIKVTGSLKADNLIDIADKEVLESKGRRIVFFSFLHTSGTMTKDGTRLVKWSDDYSFGFSKLFDKVHGVIGKFAYSHPDIDIVIKIKWHEKDWIDKIYESINRVGLSFDNINNLTIEWSGSAQNLILLSDVVVGFNSTVITEALLMKKNTIIPIYEEADNKYKEDVLWSDTNNCCIAKSNEELFDLLEKSMTNSVECYRPEGSITTEAFGYIDGNNSNRIIDEMTKYINTGHVNENCANS